MQKYSTFRNMFFLRDKKDWSKCYERVDFWVTLLAGVCLLFSYILARYVDGSGTGTTYSQMWKSTGANWALVLCGIGAGLCGLYILVTNLLFRNNAVLSSINIGLGIFIAVLFVIEYMVLKKVGFYSGETLVTMSNSAGIGFYLGVVGAVLFAGLEFYKLGAQGYYTSEDIAKERDGNGVQVVDGVVMIDGEAINTNEKSNGEENQAHTREIEQVADLENAQDDLINENTGNLDKSNK